MAPPTKRARRVKGKTSSSAVMPGFLLLDLNQNLFEKVIAKFRYKSFFRLQRTCRQMGERVRQCRNISIHVPAEYHLYTENAKVYFLRYIEGGCRETRHFYGTRLAEITLMEGKGLARVFDQMCETLKNNRITSAAFDTWDTVMTVDQCVTMMGILKPEKVSIGTSDRLCDPFKQTTTLVDTRLYEALFQSTILKKVEVHLDEKGIEAAVPRLLSTFQEVTVRADHDWEKGPRYDLLRFIQQTLYTRPFPNLQKFSFKISWRGSMEVPPRSKLEEELPGCHMTQEGNYENVLYAVCVDLPQHFPRGSSLRITIRADFHTKTTIEFEARARETISF